MIRNNQVDKRVKVINLRRSIALYIEEHGAANPYLQSLAGRVEEIIEQLRRRQTKCDDGARAAKNRQGRAGGDCARGASGERTG